MNGRDYVRNPHTRGWGGILMCMYLAAALAMIATRLAGLPIAALFARTMFSCRPRMISSCGVFCESRSMCFARS